MKSQILHTDWCNISGRGCRGSLKLITLGSESVERVTGFIFERLGECTFWLTGSERVEVRGIHSKEWSMSNFPCSLTRNITSHSMKNLAFHTLLRRRMITQTILTTSLIHFSLKRLEECTFWTWECTNLECACRVINQVDRDPHNFSMRHLPPKNGHLHTFAVSLSSNPKRCYFQVINGLGQPQVNVVVFHSNLRISADLFDVAPLWATVFPSPLQLDLPVVFPVWHEGGVLESRQALTERVFPAQHHFTFTGPTGIFTFLVHRLQNKV